MGKKIKNKILANASKVKIDKIIKLYNSLVLFQDEIKDYNRSNFIDKLNEYSSNGKFRISDSNTLSGHDEVLDWGVIL